MRVNFWKVPKLSKSFEYSQSCHLYLRSIGLAWKFRKACLLAVVGRLTNNYPLKWVNMPNVSIPVS